MDNSTALKSLVNFRSWVLMDAIGLLVPPPPLYWQGIGVIIIIFWVVSDPPPLDRAVFCEPPIFLSIFFLLDFALIGIDHHTGWEVLDVGWLSSGQQSGALVDPFWVLHQLLWFLCCFIFKPTRDSIFASFKPLVYHLPYVIRLLYFFISVTFTC